MGETTHFFKSLHRHGTETRKWAKVAGGEGRTNWEVWGVGQGICRTERDVIWWGGQMKRCVWSTCKDLYGVNAEICVGWSQICRIHAQACLGGCRFYGACCVVAEAGAHICMQESWFSWEEPLRCHNKEGKDLYPLAGELCHPPLNLCLRFSGGHLLGSMSLLKEGRRHSSFVGVSQWLRVVQVTAVYSEAGPRAEQDFIHQCIDPAPAGAGIVLCIWWAEAQEMGRVAFLLHLIVSAPGKHWKTQITLQIKQRFDSLRRSCNPWLITKQKAQQLGREGSISCNYWQLPPAQDTRTQIRFWRSLEAPSSTFKCQTKGMKVLLEILIPSTVILVLESLKGRKGA